VPAPPPPLPQGQNHGETGTSWLQVCARVAQMVAGEDCGRAISASEVATALSVPLTIAAQHLATAEAKAVLCRDDGPQGLRFFRNFFEEVAL